MATAQDIVTAALAGVAAAQQAYDDSVATLHAAQDFAGVPETGSTLASLQAQAASGAALQPQLDAANAQVKTLTDANAKLTSDNAQLTADKQHLATNLANVQADLAKAQTDASA